MNSRIKIAEERLEKALQRVDKALAGMTSDRADGERLAALEKENDILRKRHVEMAGRLDRAIERLQRALDDR